MILCYFYCLISPLLDGLWDYPAKKFLLKFRKSLTSKTAPPRKSDFEPFGVLVVHMSTTAQNMHWANWELCIDINGCLCPVIDWSPAQNVPRLLAKISGNIGSNSLTVAVKKMNGLMVQ